MRLFKSAQPTKQNLKEWNKRNVKSKLIKQTTEKQKQS